MLQTGAGGGTSKLRSPERVAPSSVATSLNTCRGRRSSRRMGGGGLDDRRSRHDFVSSTDDGAARGIRARGGGGLVQQRAAGAGAGGWQRRQARSARRFRGGRAEEAERSCASRLRAQMAPAGEQRGPRPLATSVIHRGTGRWTERERGTSRPNARLCCAARTPRDSQRCTRELAPIERAEARGATKPRAASARAAH